MHVSRKNALCPILSVILSDLERSEGESKDLRVLLAKGWESSSPNSPRSSGAEVAAAAGAESPS
jgi:hypothetical protein